MDRMIDDFFIPDNEVRLQEELDYSRVSEYIRSAEAFSRSTYQSVYIIDYFRQNFLYVSHNPMLLCGLSPEQMRDLGYRFYIQYVPEEEQPFLLGLNKAGFDFYNNIPVDERKDWYISYDFNILNSGRKILVNHKLTPLALTSDGRIWLALCIVSAATHTDAGHIEMHRVGLSDFFEYNLTTRRWDKRQMPVLTDGEKSVLTLSIQGYTMTEIADRICLSPVTIKKYRQRIFDKLDVRNISEAIVAATNNKLL
ncbi:helix-turn-helix transcriptional regulator [Duncaniella muris]|uniref:helix-turn-helix transcriptional regulator n=1 Tax=Duncaniella muris TaxID=2094150 RepID=UPI00272FFD54|nr:helix-turn-helix transcriptional regulator [Duncaniella muris]